MVSLVVVGVGVSGTCLKGNCLGKVLQRSNEMFGLGKKFGFVKVVAPTSY